MKKQKHRRNAVVPVLILVLCLACAAMFILRRSSAPEPEPDPHAGQVQIFNGSDYTWIVPEEGVPASELTADDFIADESGAPVYTGSEYTALRGIDVSGFQGDIDWEAVKASGMDFALIRIGGRGYGEEGKLYSDERFAQNIDGAKAAGLMTGVYFFSQALNTEEAGEEADLVLELLDGRKLDLPVYFDWERIGSVPARTDIVNGAAATDCAVAFCERIRSGGYRPGVYLYQYTGYYLYELSRLTDYDLWCASLGDYPYFYYAHKIWQYATEGSVPGIDTVCDMNMMFIKNLT